MLHIELEQEDDGRWIAEIPELAGVMVYGTTRADAIANVQALALRVMADRVESDHSARLTSVKFSLAKRAA